MNHILYNISVKQKRSKQEQKEGKQMLIECPANTRLQDYLLQNDIHILTACGGRGNCAKCAVFSVVSIYTTNTDFSKRLAFFNNYFQNDPVLNLLWVLQWPFKDIIVACLSICYNNFINKKERGVLFYGIKSDN